MPALIAPVKRMLVSAAHKSSGKTVIATGLCAAMKAQGADVRPFKKGPDYIDPKWLSLAAGRDCYNLDFNVQSGGEIRAMAATHAPPETIGVVEANKGLHDGLALDGGDSNAALAQLLGLPVLLVIDCEGITRGVAPLLLGLRDFSPKASIEGVILNRTGGARHRAKLVAAVEHYTDIPVLGAVARDPRLVLPERHLGLVPSNEVAGATDAVAAMCAAVGEQVNVDAVLEMASSPRRATPPARAEHHAPPRPAAADLRVGVFRDQAFGFYYPDDLEDLERCGAELVFIDGLRDARLPRLDGLFIGGGFPETRAGELEANRELRAQVRRAIESGLPTYAECGGLMYLARSIIHQGRRFEMCGIIQADALMHETPRGRGYVEFSETAQMPWPGDGGRAPRRAHEFHYAGLVGATRAFTTAYKVLRGAGLGDGSDGIVHKNLLATWLHQRATAADRWTRRFTDFIRLHRIRV